MDTGILWMFTFAIVIVAFIAYNQHHKNKYAQLEREYTAMRDSAWYWYDAYWALENNWQGLKREYDMLAYERRIEQGKANTLPKASDKDKNKYSITMLPGMPELPKDKALSLDSDGVIIAVDKPKVESEKPKDNGKAKSTKGETEKQGEFSLEIIDAVAKAMEIKASEFSEAEKSKINGWEKSDKTKWESEDHKINMYASRLMKARNDAKGEKLTPDNVKGNNGKSNGNGHSTSSLDALARITEAIAKLANN